MSYDCEEQWKGLPVKHLVLATTDFIVFIDYDNDVDWKTTNKYDEDNSGSADANRILNDAAAIETIPCNNLSEDNILNFKRLIAESIARCLSKDFENANTMLDAAKEFVLSRNREKSRLWYLMSSGIFCGVIFLIGLLILNYKILFIERFGNNIYLCAMSSVSGAFGALFSIIMRLGGVSLDCSSGKMLHTVEGVSRILAGVLSGLVACLAILSGLLIPFVKGINNSSSCIVIVALIFGASERFALSLISKQELAVGKKDFEKQSKFTLEE